MGKGVDPVTRHSSHGGAVRQEAGPSAGDACQRDSHREAVSFHASSQDNNSHAGAIARETAMRAAGGGQ
jgi:hypothetical protein